MEYSGFATVCFGLCDRVGWQEDVCRLLVQWWSWLKADFSLRRGHRMQMSASGNQAPLPHVQTGKLRLSAQGEEVRLTAAQLDCVFSLHKGTVGGSL